MLTEKVLEMARSKNLDLVEVAPDAKPPVCRIMDYGKYKYRQKKRTQKSRRGHHGTQVKEVRLRMKIFEHDLEVKLKKVREFLGHGDRVLVNLFLRGREAVHMDLAREKLTDVAGRLEDVARVEQQPKMEGRRITMVLVPR